MWVGGVLAVVMLGLMVAAWLGAFGDRAGWPLWIATFMSLQGAVLFAIVAFGGRRSGRSASGGEPPGDDPSPSM